MAKVELGKAQSVVADEAVGLRITIPSKKNWFILPFMTFWLCCWAVGWVVVAFKLITGGIRLLRANLFLVGWLRAWTVGGIAALTIALWMAFGKEVVTVKPDSLVVRSLIFGRGITKEYDLMNVKNLRVNTSLASDAFGFMNGVRFWRVGYNLVSFDYGAKTHRFGDGIDEPEAADIVNVIKQRFNIS